ncbi:MAG: NADH-quinone oxidoreductase subunit L [Proteobacteria bacterium]|nr:NADH-quinone oxidoreductase subunit L [Pseudomonadota bacterium]
MTKTFPLLWIPLLPLLGAAINLLCGRVLSRRAVNVVACGSVAGALGVVVFAVFGRLWPLVGAAEGTHLPARLVQTAYAWITAGSVDLPVGLVCDPLSAVMLLVVTLVGFLIHLYSTGYMAHERDYARFFGYLNLFTGAMLILVLADNLPLLFVGWEGVGVCSYLLIGFWYDKDGTERLGLANAMAGRKAFLVNRVGDVAFLLGMLVLFAATRTLSIESLALRASDLLLPLHPLGLGPYTVAGVAGLLLFIGAMGKSAQIPLYVWLPDAMAGPTPVSALIHAATMVTAGVYMVARMNFLFMLSPAVMGLIALVGATTALFAASIGFAQHDIKKVLAYSTISQLGYMFVAVGVGAFSAGIFHLFTHAFFKACLFLGAGAIIHALHDEQDLRQMGGLRRPLATTHWTFLVSTLAIAGIPPLSGFFSKDEILWRAIATANPALGSTWLPALLYVMSLAAALCTAFYMFRLYGLVFLGERRGTAPASSHGHAGGHVGGHPGGHAGGGHAGGGHAGSGHAGSGHAGSGHAGSGHAGDLHLPGPAMEAPLIVLAGGAALLGLLGLPEVVGSWLGIEHINLFERWLAPVVDQGARLADRWAGGQRVAANALAESHGLEALLLLLSVAVAVGSSALAWKLYRAGPSALVERLTARLRWFYRLVLNKYWVDELYDWTIVRPYKALAVVLFQLVDRLVIDRLGVHGTARSVDGVGRVLRRLQTGNVQHYVVGLVIGITALVVGVVGAALLGGGG